ncbi:MAG: tautomerase family protein [Spirochaetaceae bacterium]|nr:MAG: tautomerase family protein [Spirochaetaceae bacterium]
MPSITIEMFEGRTVDQKRSVAQNVTQAIIDTLGVKREIVKIRFIDIKKHDIAWGGELVSDRGK